jgi:hypothetical protein
MAHYLYVYGNEKSELFKQLTRAFRLFGDVEIHSAEYANTALHDLTENNHYSALITDAPLEPTLHIFLCNKLRVLTPMQAQFIVITTKQGSSYLLKPTTDEAIRVCLGHPK